MAEESWFDSWQGQDSFLFFTASRVIVTYPVGTRGLSPGVKWLWHEVDHSTPSNSAEVKNVLSYTSTHPFVCMAWCLINYAHGQCYLTCTIIPYIQDQIKGAANVLGHLLAMWNKIAIP
jgi:hypothetical protein